MEIKSSNVTTQDIFQFHCLYLYQMDKSININALLAIISLNYMDQALTVD